MNHLTEKQKEHLLVRSAGALSDVRRWADRIGARMPVEVTERVENIRLALAPPEARDPRVCRTCGKQTAGFVSPRGEYWLLCEMCAEEALDRLAYEKRVEMRDDAEDGSDEEK